ncbi:MULTISPECIES: ABC transporter substrate-binding protein [unclassified Streptomyces]|uniref:ABC transporter substrate-binding protein n=1 Tax=unclassified Streptomyces TaxID=2593676 RepID=UPI0036E2D067
MDTAHEVRGGMYRRRDVIRLLGAGAGVMAAGGLLSACGGSSSAGTSPDGTLTVKDQLGWLKLTQYGGFYAAEKKGYYAAEKISTTFTAGGPNILAWQQIASGRAMTGDDDNTNVLVAAAKGRPLVIYGAIFQTSPFAIISKKSDPITGIEDFAGRTIAVTEASRAQFESLVKKAGVKNVSFIPAGTDPTQLTTGQASGYSGYATSQAVALERQGVPVHVLYLEDLGVKSYGNVLVTTKEHLDAHHDELVRFLSATIKGHEYMNAHPEEIGKLVATEWNTSGLKAAEEMATAKFQKDLIASPKGVLRVDPDKMQTIIDDLVSVGTLPKRLKAADVVTTSVLDAAYGSRTSLLS